MTKRGWETTKKYVRDPWGDIVEIPMGTGTLKVNDRVGSLVLKQFYHDDEATDHAMTTICRCDCGVRTIVPIQQVFTYERGTMTIRKWENGCGEYCRIYLGMMKRPVEASPVEVEANGD